MRRFTIQEEAHSQCMNAERYEKRILWNAEALRQAVVESGVFVPSVAAYYNDSLASPHYGTQSNPSLQAHADNDPNLVDIGTGNVVGYPRSFAAQKSKLASASHIFTARDTIDRDLVNRNVYSWYELLFLQPHKPMEWQSNHSLRALERDDTKTASTLHDAVNNSAEEAMLCAPISTVFATKVDNEVPAYYQQKEALADRVVGPPTSLPEHLHTALDVFSAASHLENTHSNILKGSLQSLGKATAVSNKPDEIFLTNQILSKVICSSSHEAAPAIATKAIPNANTYFDDSMYCEEAAQIIHKLLSVWKVLKSNQFVFQNTFKKNENALLTLLLELLTNDDILTDETYLHRCLESHAKQLSGIHQNSVLLCTILKALTPIFLTELMQCCSNGSAKGTAAEESSSYSMSKQQAEWRRDAASCGIDGAEALYVIKDASLQNSRGSHRRNVSTEMTSNGYYETPCPSVNAEFLQFGGFPSVPADMELGNLVRISPFSSTVTNDFALSYHIPLHHPSETTSHGWMNRTYGSSLKDIIEDTSRVMLLANGVSTRDTECRDAYNRSEDGSCKFYSHPTGFKGFSITKDGHLKEDLLFQLLRNDFGNREQRARHTVYQNRHFDAQRKLNIDVFKPEFYFHHRELRLGPSTVHGYGVFAAENISCGDWIVEYVGLVVSEAIADKRESMYMDTIGGSTYFFKLGNNDIIDATQCGNITRFINHSCEPNCKPVDFGDEDEAVGWHVIIQALRNIESGEELFYNYRLSEGALGKEECFCGSINCVGFM